MLTQELLVYLSMFIQTEPDLFNGMSRVRIGLIIQVHKIESESQLESEIQLNFLIKRLMLPQIFVRIIPVRLIEEKLGFDQSDCLVWSCDQMEACDWMPALTLE